MADFEQHIRSGKTPWGIWWSLIAGFLAWGLDLGLSYILEQHSCSTGHHYVLHLISIVCFAIALSGGAFGLLEFRQFPKDTAEEGGSHFDRAHFQALMGIGFSAAFAVLIIAGSVPRWILSPCS
jgi:hypothetical protein